MMDVSSRHTQFWMPQWAWPIWIHPLSANLFLLPHPQTVFVSPFVVAKVISFHCIQSSPVKAVFSLVDWSIHPHSRSTVSRFLRPQNSMPEIYALSPSPQRWLMSSFIPIYSKHKTKFSNIRQNWKSLIANTHKPTTYILLLTFYYTCFIACLSIYPPLHLVVKLPYFLVHFRVNCRQKSLPPK